MEDVMMEKLCCINIYDGFDKHRGHFVTEEGLAHQGLAGLISSDPRASALVIDTAKALAQVAKTSTTENLMGRLSDLGGRFKEASREMQQTPAARVAGNPEHTSPATGGRKL